jgi:hypothetical protein
MKDKCNKVTKMEKVNNFLKMEVIMKANIKKVYNMEVESLEIMIRVLIKVNFKMENIMV